MIRISNNYMSLNKQVKNKLQKCALNQTFTTFSRLQLAGSG
ncbi:hypothetical protein PATSB16_40290 [Pandoraea thiooxydans]|nr:hypothetical protein PATSB16_40290 [Pandoraea thiooxydans]